MKEKLKFLQIDTSNENYLFIKLVNNKIQKHILIEEKRCHMKKLIPSINNLLLSEGLDIKDLDFIAFNLGPGSWTGLRIGLSTIKTLWQVTQLNIIFYNNFELVINKNNINTGVILVKSSNDKYYFQVLNNSEVTNQDISSLEEINNLYSNLNKYYFNDKDLETDDLLIKKFNSKNFIDVKLAEPIYISEGVILNKNEE